MSRNLALRRGAALLIDLLGTIMLLLLIRPALPFRLAESPALLLGGPLLITPILIYASTRMLGRTLGQTFTGTRRLTRGSGKRPSRLYDFIFESEVSLDPESPIASWMAYLGALGCLVLTSGFFFFSAARDPKWRAAPEKRIPLFAPEPNQGWKVLPWFYASGAWPTLVENQPVLYSLPYEKGPPQRFVGRIHSYVGRSGARIVLTGPLTLKNLGSRESLRRCFSRLLTCPSIRREVFERPLAPFFKLARLEHAEWIVVDNPMLREEERPEGLLLTGRSRGGEIVEGYFLINDLMRFQGFLLSRPDHEDGERASKLLLQALGSFRVTSEIEASRAWINQSLSRLDLGRSPDERKLREAQGLLLSKISVDPAAIDPFYHLTRITGLLHQRAVQQSDLEAAASARTLIQTALRFARDIAPEDERIREMEAIQARTTPR